MLRPDDTITDGHAEAANVLAAHFYLAFASSMPEMFRGEGAAARGSDSPSHVRDNLTDFSADRYGED